MRIPLSWISLYTPISKLIAENNVRHLAHIYSTHTAEIDAIEEYMIDKVVIGKVLSCEKHPESKKLSIVRVDQGIYGEETILTWAANIVDAKYVAVAMVGAVLPWDFTISERAMAGMISRGMICGADEIGVSKQESTGIMILEEIWDEKELEEKIGASFFDLKLPFPWRNGETFHYPLGEPMFEIDNKFITNRPDLFSVVGNAREFHAVFEAATVLTSQTQEVSWSESLHITKSLKKLETEIQTKNCLSYHLLEMSDITVGKSPFGIELMMERAWLSVKMDFVDITNLIMTELGQPMHVFDKDKLVGNIRVRQAKNGETIIALNGTTYTLTEDDMVIADGKWPVAIAWVIGGMESAVSESTKNIIWESACFDATAVRLTAQRHGIRTDASTRYEKSLDPTLAGTPFGRVIEYLNFLWKKFTLTGASHYIDATRINEKWLEIAYSFINMKAWVEIPKDTVNAILTRLGFQVSSTTGNTDIEKIQSMDAPDDVFLEKFHVRVPSWRASKDVNIKEDIAEEVARVYGYDKTPLRSLGWDFRISQKNTDAKLRNIILSHFAHHHWNEIYTYSFTNEKLESQILSPSIDQAIWVVNAFHEEYTHMRTSLAPRLLMAASENLKQSKQFGFFEIGKIYKKNEANQSPLLKNIWKKPLLEQKKVAWVLIGSNMEQLRKDIESLLSTILSYIPPVHSGTNLTFLHPGVSGSYRENDVVIAEFWKIHPAVASAFWLVDGLYFELDFATLLDHMENSEIRFQPISRYQTIPRELNFVMDTHTPTGEVARSLDALHPWITSVTVDSIFEDSEKIGTWKKSVNFAFTLSNHDATISDEEALSVQNLIITEMNKKGFELRWL